MISLKCSQVTRPSLWTSLAERFQQVISASLDLTSRYSVVELLARRKHQSKGLAKKPERIDFEACPEGWHEGQRLAWAAWQTVVLVLAGRQSGKTIIGPPWMAREIQRRGPGDYGLNGPTLELLNKKCLPEYVRFFEKKHKLAKYNQSKRCFEFTQAGLFRMFGTDDYDELRERYANRDADGNIVDVDFDVHVTIFVGYARKPESLESATYKAVHSDEPGQSDFKLESYEALEGRRAIYNGRHLLTTTPYDLGWLKTKLFDAWERGDDWISVVRFESIMNPTFRREVFDKLKATLASWKFDLFYRAIFTRPASAIYDIFSETHHTLLLDPSKIPVSWTRAVGVDFGNVNTAAVFIAVDPDSDPNDPDMYVYATYHYGGLDAVEHYEAWLRFLPPGSPVVAVGGARSEGRWRADYANAGLTIEPPTVADVEKGIEYVYAALKRGKLLISNRCRTLISQLQDYKREIDASGEPIPKTIANKASYHLLDALRYEVSQIVTNPYMFTRPGERIRTDVPNPYSLIEEEYDETETTDIYAQI